MAITKKQLTERKTWIGSSDVAALLGLSPWANAYDLWLRMTDKLEPQPPAKGAMEDGIIMEPGMLTWAVGKLGELVTDPEKLWFKHKTLKLISHPDALVAATGEPVEVKTSGMRGILPPGWGEEGTDQIPEYYLIQAQVHLMLTGKEVCYVPAYLGGRGPTMFYVKHNPEIHSHIEEKVAEFYEQFVKKDIPPPDTIPHLEIVKRMIRAPGLLVEIPSGLIEEVRQAKQKKAESEAACKQAEAALLAALGEAEGSVDGQVTYFQQTRKEYTVPESTFRVLRIKKEKI